MMRPVHRFGVALMLPLNACALQPTYQRPALEVPATWSNLREMPISPITVERENWWTLLGDPAVDTLVTVGLRDNPTLTEAAARVDRARAALVGQDTRKLPRVGVEGGVSIARDRAGSGNATTSQTSASIGPRLSWELDLWGRVRESATAAGHRLTARNADAEAARLAVIGDIGDTALALRACYLTLALRDRDIASRETELKIAKARLSLGAIAPATVAGAESTLASARTDRIGQAESCHYRVNALVALSGLETSAINQLIPQELQAVASSGVDQPDIAKPVAKPPAFVPALPAPVLRRHPSVVSAEREVAARWSEIAVARAERLPRIDLVAVLTGQWISALGTDDSFVSSSLGAAISGPIFDGGAGKANVRGAEAAYREAVAGLVLTIRSAIRDIEDALVAQKSAEARVATSADAVAAAKFTLRADEARWRAGAIARYELEESRRQFNRAQESRVLASSDLARAWVALVRRTGPAWPAEDAPNHGADVPSAVIPQKVGGQRK